MKRITLASKRYPGIHIADAPQVPGAPSNTPGDFLLAVDTAMEVTDETCAHVRALLDRTPERVSRHFSLSVVDLAPAAESAVPAPKPQPAKSDPVPEPEIESAEVEVLTELSEDDLDLIQIELGKIANKTIAEAKPTVTKLAGNPDIPLLLRQEYLKEILKDEMDTFQKGLKDHVQDLLDDIS